MFVELWVICDHSVPSAVYGSVLEERRTFQMYEFDLKGIRARYSSCPPFVISVSVDESSERRSILNEMFTDAGF